MTDWKRKLLAFLHDPPHKPRAIAAHEDQRQSYLNRLGFDPDALREFDRTNDWQAAAADRLVFPDPAKSGLRVDWAANDYEFRHPLGGGRLTPRQFPATAAGMEEAFASLASPFTAEPCSCRESFSTGPSPKMHSPASCCPAAHPPRPDQRGLSCQ